MDTVSEAPVFKITIVSMKIKSDTADTDEGAEDVEFPECRGIIG